MEKKKDDRFIYTTNNKKIGARAKVDGQPALAIVKNGQVEGFIPASELSQLLYDTQKPCIKIDTAPPPRQNP